MALSSRGSAPRTLWDFLFVTAFVPAVAWDRVTDESSLQDDLVRVAREDLSFKQEEIDGTFESAVAAYVPYRSLATTMANRLHNYIDKWSRSEEKPGSKKCLKCLLDDWSTIRDGFMSALSSQSLEPPSKCLVLGLFASDVVYHVLSKLIGDEEHEGREPIWKMLSGALINVVLPVDLLSQAGRRLLRTIKRQAVKDLEQSGWSPVGLRWYDFDMAICEGYGDDDALVESPQPTRVQKAIESATVPIRALKFTEDFIDKAPRALVVPPLATTPSSPQGAIHPTPVRGRPVSNYYLPAAGGGTSVIDQVSAIEEPIREGVVSPGDRHKAITAAKGLPQISPPYKGLSDSRRFSWLKATIRKVLRAAAADVPTHWYYLQRSIDINLFNQIPLPNFDPCDMASFCRATAADS
ncbi:hypothetical protein FOZ61_002456 [Perkinsus olseni]|uniref:Uncharacterized protein n=1 Tax=Perkinsus olseni TaxID=32597 RepID=A0A7J6LTX6_PEROL|nr:hypothetical protein FOZ61_002456 [Perkinsus olseni]